MRQATIESTARPTTLYQRDQHAHHMLTITIDRKSAHSRRQLHSDPIPPPLGPAATSGKTLDVELEAPADHRKRRSTAHSSIKSERPKPVEARRDGLVPGSNDCKLEYRAPARSKHACAFALRTRRSEKNHIGCLGSLPAAAC
jgi:hypothetical protein